jgi:hypothetical protein
MAVWREGQRFIEGKDHNTLDGELRKPFVIDRLYVKGASKKLGVVVVLDFGRGHSLLLGTLNEDDPWFVKSWIESHLKGIRVNVMVGNTGQLIKYEDALPDSLPAWLADHGHKHNNSER